jgi:hypothetical protein
MALLALLFDCEPMSYEPRRVLRIGATLEQNT